MINSQVPSSKKKILIISPVPSHPQNSGNRIRIFNMLKILQNLGYFIEFLYVDRERNSKHVITKVSMNDMMNEWDNFIYFPSVGPALSTKSDNRPINYFSVILKRNKILIQSFSHFLRDKLDELIGIFGWRLYKINPTFYKKIRKLILGNKQSFSHSKIKIEEDYVPTPPALSKKKYSGLKKTYSLVKTNSQVISHTPKIHTKKIEAPKKQATTSDLINRKQFIDERYPDRLNELIKTLNSRKNYHAVICEYVFFSQSLLQFDENTLKVIDTHDCFANRNQRLAQYNLQNVFFSTTPKEEGKGLNRADIIIAIQDEERQIFERECKRPVATVGHSIQIVQSPAINPSGKNILYVGSGNEGNRQAVDFFINEIWPLVLEKDPTVQLVLAGGICMHYTGIPNCKLAGEVPSLQSLYQNADVAINSAIIGTGLKIKTIEALGFGCPMVCTTHAAIGIDREKSGLIIADAPEEFARKIVELLNDYQLRIELSQKGIQYAKAYNKNIIRSLELIFDK